MQTEPTQAAATPPARKPGLFRARNLLIIVGAVMLLCIGLVVWGTFLNATPSGQATSTARALAALTDAATKLTPAPSSTPKPTETAAPPTNTSAPTDTQPPTATDLPTETSTPEPTNTAAPEPVKLEGTGDQIVDVENPFELGVVHIVGNASSRYFGVTSYGADNETIESLVNTTDPYDGWRPLDFGRGEHTVRFEVKSNGPWTIELMSLDSAHAFQIPGSYAGTGDDVVIMLGGDPDTAQITGNASSRYFGVTAHGSDGNSDNLVNTTDVYDGKVLMSPKALVLEVLADGDWTIDVKTK